MITERYESNLYTQIRMIIVFKAVSGVRRLVGCPVDVKFVLDKVALGPGSPPNDSVFSCQYHSINASY